MFKLLLTTIALTAIGVGVKANKVPSLTIKPGSTLINNKTIIVHQ